MKTIVVEIEKDLYEQIHAHGDIMTKAEENEYFSDAIRWGYGLYGTYVFEKDGKYWLKYSRGDSCD